MYRPSPTLHESADELKRLLQREHDGRKKPRLQMLYLLASEQASTRQDVAQLLGLSRTTVGRWLDVYASGGMDALLDISIPPRKQPSLSADVLASLEQALQQDEGFASYEALRQWLEHTHQIEIKDNTLYAIVRTKCKAKLKVPRPSHTQKP